MKSWEDCAIIVPAVEVLNRRWLMDCKKIFVFIVMLIGGIRLSAWGGGAATDFIDDSNSNTNQWSLSETVVDGSGRKFSNDGESITSPMYDGAVVSVSVSAKNVGFKTDGVRSILKIEAKAPEAELWAEIHQLVFVNGSATNETVSLERGDNYRQFRIVFEKGAGTMRVSSFNVTWRADGEVAAPFSLNASDVTSDSFYATWTVDEPVECFLFDCWSESMTPWAGSLKWCENFTECVNPTKSAKKFTEEMFGEYGLAGWSGDFAYLPAGGNGSIQVNKATESVGWLITPALPAMENVELVVRARAFAMQPDHVMPVFIVRGGSTNELAAFELADSFADCHCSVPAILEGDRLAFKSFSVGSKRRVLIDSISLVEGFMPGRLVTNVVCDGVMVGYSDSPGYHVDELDADTRYGFSVRAMAGGTESAPSEACIVETAVSGEEEESGDWSGAVASDIAHTSFRLDWPMVHGAAGYRVSVWTNELEGASAGNVIWQESFSQAMAASSTSPSAISDSEKFNENYSDNSGWTVISNVYPSVDAGTVRIGNTSKPGELISPPMAAVSGGVLRVKVRRQTASEGAVFSVWRSSGNALSEIGEAQEIKEEMTECVYALPEMKEGDCIVFRSASGKKSYRTLLDEVEVLEGYSAGVSTPKYVVDAVEVSETSYAVEVLPSAVWMFSVEAVDASGAVVAASTNMVDLLNPPPRPVLDAVAISGIRRKGGERIWHEDFRSFTNVFPTGKNTANWLNGTTLSHWQAYCGGNPVADVIRNNGAGTKKGLYAYWATNEVVETYSLGTMTTGTAEEYVYGLSFRNDTAFSVRKIAVRFDGVQFGFKNKEVQELVCEYLVTNELVSIVADGDWRVCDDLIYFTSKDNTSGLESGKDLPVATEISAEITDASIPNDWHFMLRWRRSAISNAAAMAIDNVSVAFTVQSRPLTIVVR